MSLHRPHIGPLRAALMPGGRQASNTVENTVEKAKVEKAVSDENKQPELEEDEVTLSPEAETSEESTAVDESPEIAALKEELAQAKEQVLRAAAEAQNARRRAEQDVEKAHKYALEKFVSDLLPVADNMERAIGAATAEGADLNSVVEGVELTLKSLFDAFKRHNVEMLDPKGEPFDPQVHQAMTMVPQPEAEPNSVLDVFQKGYTLNGRLVRPAMVVVAKSE